MPIENPDFSEEGAAPGLPRAWSVTSVVQAERIAGFGPAAPYESAETFERWLQLLVRLGAIEQAFFDQRPEGFEDFAEGWDVDFYAVDFADVGVENATFASELVERFSLGWEVDVFAWELDAVVRASFGSGQTERFENGHRNDGYRFQYAEGDLLRASLSGAAVETFEHTWPAHDTRGGGHHGE
jgi:hypothetical protein